MSQTSQKTRAPKMLTRLRSQIAAKLGPPTWKTRDLAEKAQVQQLWEGVEADTGHPLLVHFLSWLIERANVPARDPIKLARAIQLYSARHIKFFRERPERFQAAIRTVVWGIGDCDDKARFVAACLRTFRIPVRLKVLHMTLPDGKQLGHVYPQAWLEFPAKPARWVSLESVREFPMGYDPETKALARGYKVKTTYVGDKGEDQIHI